MEQVIMLWILGLVAFAGFLLYPRLMFGLIGSLVRGICGLVVDAIALLFVWI